MIWIIVGIGVIVVFSIINNFLKDLKQVQKLPFMVGFKIFSNRLNQRFFNNLGSIKMINEMEYHIIPPQNHLFVIYLKIKYTGKKIRITAIDFAVEERIEFDFTFEVNNTLNIIEQEKLADKYCEMYGNNLKEQNE